MFATIRTYTPKPNSMNTASMEQLRRQIHDQFLPMAQKIEGFHSYYAVNAGNRKLITVSVFETQKGCAESTRRAAEFIKKTPLPFDTGTPEVIEGDVITAAEVGREVVAH
ncbi:MAG: hypothetical protein ACREL3_01060 [Gemmatimonadales bacterium]